MPNKTALDDKTTDFLGSRMDAFHEDLLKKILEKWKESGKKTTKGTIVDAGVELVAKQEGLYPECHLVVAEIKPGLWDDEKELRERGYTDDDFGNEGLRGLSAREGLMDRTKTVVKSETMVCEGS